MTAGRPGTSSSGAAPNSTFSVNKLAETSTDAGRRRLLRIALTRTDSADLLDVLRQGADAEAASWQAKIDALPTVEEMTARAQMFRAAEEERTAAREALERIERLPPGHIAALLRIAADAQGWRGSTVARTIEGLRDGLNGPLCLFRFEREPGAAYTADRLAITAANVLARVGPPEDIVSEAGWRLVRGDEDEIHEAAHEAAERGRVALDVALFKDDVTPDDRERACVRWWTRRLRREALRAQAYADCAFRMARPGSPYVSRYTLEACEDRAARGAEWAERTFAVFEDGTRVKLADIIASGRRARLAQLYAMVKAMEWLGQQGEMVALFWTLTLPGEWHSYSVGPRAADGTYPQAHVNENWTPEHGPKAQMRALNELWAQVRARLAKHEALRDYFGIKTIEPHINLTPHLHAMTWLPRQVEVKGEMVNTVDIVTEILEDLAPGRQGRVEVVEKTGPRTATPASYVMKYVMKALNASAADRAALGIVVDGTEPEDGEDHLSDDMHSRHVAWARARGVRRYALLGVHGGLTVWQRLWTAKADEPMPERASTVWDAMRRAEDAGRRAEAAKADSEERTAARREQTEATAAALVAMGALRGHGDGGGLRLGYEEGETQYGRPTRRAVTVYDTDTGEFMPLRRQRAQLVTEPRNTASTDLAAVTLMANCPRGGAEAPPAAGGEVIRPPFWRTRPSGLMRAPPSEENPAFFGCHEPLAT